MGHRLSKISTRTGDDGTTGLGDGSRVGKDHPRVAAMGAVDELNSAVGLILTEPLPDDLRMLLLDVQNDLFDLGGQLSVPGRDLLEPERVASLEEALTRLNKPLPPLKEFILPGGTRSGALSHVARTICRRAERQVFAMAKSGNAGGQALPYLNRLSDLLFVLARTVNRAQNLPETEWRRPAGR